jgi:tRNA uridine 5-carbamoylmethylation protein Kti12
VSRLVITRGLPGSGKTTLAEKWRDAAPGRARVSRGVLRDMLAGGGRWEASRIAEATLSEAEDGIVSGLLAAGLDVIVDDTNLDPVHVVFFELLADVSQAEFTVVDLTDVAPGLCLLRNAGRGEADLVPSGWISRAYSQHIEGQPHPLPYPFRFGGRQVTPAELLGEEPAA